MIEAARCKFTNGMLNEHSSRTICHRSDLFYEHRRDFAGLLCREVGKLLELLGTNLTNVSEQEDEGKLDPNGTVSLI